MRCEVEETILAQVRSHYSLLVGFKIDRLQIAGSWNHGDDPICFVPRRHQPGNIPVGPIAIDVSQCLPHLPVLGQVRRCSFFVYGSESLIIGTKYRISENRESTVRLLNTSMLELGQSRG